MEPKSLIPSVHEKAVSSHAATREEIAPLIALCRAGKLFDVQAWIAEGKPVNPPLGPAKGSRARSPLAIAMALGFHSLMEVLLRAGAIQDPPSGYGSPIGRALDERRLDMIELLMQHGCDACNVEFIDVLRSWDPKIFEFFLKRDPDLSSLQPFAQAFCERVRTALKPFKDLVAVRPELQEQANVALRYHAKEGDIKWVSLMLWLGADPLKPGSETPGIPLENEEHGLSALAYAALYRHFEVFKLKRVRDCLATMREGDFVHYLDRGEGIEILHRLLKGGWPPNDLTSGGCSMIPRLIYNLTWSERWSSYPVNMWAPKSSKQKFDSEESRSTMKVIHILAKHGAKWIPQQDDEISQVRRSLLKMTSNYTAEFVWIMAKYHGCNLACIKRLLESPTMRANTSVHRERITNLLSGWDAEDPVAK